MKFSFFYVLLFSFLYSSFSIANPVISERACIRDFSSGSNPCDRERIFAWFPVADGKGQEFCVMSTTDDRCHDQIEGFFFVDTLDGERICMQNFTINGAEEDSPCASAGTDFFKWFYFAVEEKLMN